MEDKQQRKHLTGQSGGAFGVLLKMKLEYSKRKSASI